MVTFSLYFIKKNLNIFKKSQKCVLTRDIGNYKMYLGKALKSAQDVLSKIHYERKWFRMNKKLLVSKMKLFGDTQADLANAIGCSSVTLNFKINGTTEFKQGEIVVIRDRYHLSAEEVDQIFFTHNVE